MRRLSKYHELFTNLAIKEIKVRYKQSVMGVAWTFIQPLSMMIVFTIIFTQFTKIQTGGIPYPLFSYCALLPWGFFASSLSSAIPSVVLNMNLVTKIYFPREMFPLSIMVARFFDFSIASLLFLGLMVYYHVSPSIYLLFVPLIFLIQVIFTLGVVLFASALNVFLRDITHIIPLVVQVWMYLTPIIYPTSLIPEKYLTFYFLNPMAAIIDAYRDTIILGQSPKILFLGVAAVISVVIFYFGYRFFISVEKKFADII